MCRPGGTADLALRGIIVPALFQVGPAQVLRVAVEKDDAILRPALRHVEKGQFFGAIIVAVERDLDMAVVPEFTASFISPRNHTSASCVRTAGLFISKPSLTMGNEGVYLEEVHLLGVKPVISLIPALSHSDLVKTDSRMKV